LEFIVLRVDSVLIKITFRELSFVRRFDLVHCFSEKFLENVSLVFMDVSTKRPYQSKCTVVHDGLLRVVASIFILKRNCFFVQEYLNDVQTTLNKITVLRGNHLFAVLSDLWHQILDS
jgi:hypothetical protein